MASGAARTTRPIGRAPAEGGLTAPARRLLHALGEPGGRALPHPGDAGTLILAAAGRSGPGGVTLGRGSIPAAAARELVARDLARRDGDVVLISEPGRARLRREAAAGEDAFGSQHRDLERAGPARGDAREATRSEVVVNAAESPLAWLRRRRGRDGEPLVDAAAFEAGERFRRDVTQAGMLPSVTARWDGAVGRGEGAARDPAAAADATVAARQRVRRAMAAVGPDLGDLLLDLCGFLKGLELIERERGWPPRSAKVVAGLALGRLAAHYGLAREAHGPERSRGLRSWVDGAEGEARAG